LNLFAGTGIAACTSGTLSNRKCTEPNECHCIAFAQLIFNPADQGIQGAACGRFGDVSTRCNVVDQLGFVHVNQSYVNVRQRLRENSNFGKTAGNSAKNPLSKITPDKHGGRGLGIQTDQRFGVKPD